MQTFSATRKLHLLVQLGYRKVTFCNATGHALLEFSASNHSQNHSTMSEINAQKKAIIKNKLLQLYQFSNNF